MTGSAPAAGEDTGGPGPASRGLATRLKRVECRNVTFLSEGFPVFWREARGWHVHDVDGNRYVDLSAGFGVSVLGHGHPDVVAAIREQAGRLVHGMGDVHPPEPKVGLLETFASLSPWPETRVTLGTGGAEAVEIALKTAALATGRPGVVAFTGAYHGLSYGALAVTDGEAFRDPFTDQLNPHVLRAPFPNPYRPPPDLADVPREALGLRALDRLRALLDTGAGSRVGAVLVEPIQGRGGHVLPPEDFLPGLAGLCRRRGLLLIADEIYTGLGRTGARFASVAAGMTPDLICVGKSGSGGLPISACLGRADVMDAWPESTGEAIHTSTFLGNPVACAAARATLEVLEASGLAARARREGERWLGSLRRLRERHQGVGDVRGRGLMVGVELVRDSASRRPDAGRAVRVVREALRRGWILLAGGTDGNVLSLSPPLVTPAGVLDDAVDLLDEALAATAGE